MSLTVIIISAVVISVTGLVVGFGLGLFGKKFQVEIDPREAAIRECLPGTNCGACGLAGCDAMAKAINEGTKPSGGCPVGGAPVAEKISAILGVTAAAVERKTAYVKCKGNWYVIKDRYKYSGMKDCSKAGNVPGGGAKACTYGCLGFGTCASVCEFDAIRIVNGIAVVDKEKCHACGKCVKACPRHLIELVPYDAKYLVRCSSQDKGAAVRNNCEVGCLSCGLCVKSCPNEAIVMNGNVAHIEQEKCLGCGLCAQKCPSKVIESF